MDTNYEYVDYIDFATKIHNWLTKKHKVLIGIYSEKLKKNNWIDCHCVNYREVYRPYQIIPFDSIITSQSAMEALFSEGFVDAYSH